MDGEEIQALRVRSHNLGGGATSGQRAFALFLTGVLTFESAFGTGLATALAEPLADGTGAQDLVQLVESDEPTSVRIATAEVQDEGPSLKVTLVDPENIADQTDQIADQTESTTTDEQLITTVSSRIELPVSLKTSPLSEDEGKLAWNPPDRRRRPEQQAGDDPHPPEPEHAH